MSVEKKWGRGKESLDLQQSLCVGETEEKSGRVGRDGEGGETLGKVRGEDVRKSREETSGSNSASSWCGMTPGAWAP